MASDFVVIGLAVLAVAGPIVTRVYDLRYQAKMENQRQSHELRRDRQAKYYEFRLAEYRERRLACESLLASVRQASILATTRGRFYEQYNNPKTPETLAAANAEGEAFNSARDLSTRYADEALKLLGTDPDAVPVLNAYYSLPLDDLLKAATDSAVKEAWADGCANLQMLVYDYLRALRERLVSDDLTTAETPQQS
jgi:hypothetical protein